MSTASQPIIALTFREIATALSFYKLGVFGTIDFPLYIPPGSSSTLVYPVPQGNALILDLLAMYSTVDGALSVFAYVDDTLLVYDESFVNEVYPPGGILFFDRGMIPVAKNHLTVTAVNNSSSAVNFYVRIEFAQVAESIYNNLLRNYFSAIEKVIRGE